MPEMVGFCLPTKESGSGAKVEAMTGLASTADAVNRKADVAFGRGCDGDYPGMTDRSSAKGDAGTEYHSWPLSI